MTGQQFLNAVRVLWSIDKHELVEAGFPASAWGIFAADPIDFIIHCDDDTFAKIWSVVLSRLKTS